MLTTLLTFVSGGLQAQELQLGIQPTTNGTFALYRINFGEPKGHTFIEFSTNGVSWFPAYYVNSNSFEGGSYSITNIGSARLFRAMQGEAVARDVAASWQRLGVTNYVFRYSELCLCALGFMTRGSVTVMSNQVVKVEDASDRSGAPVPNPSLERAPTIDELLDAWVASETNGGHAWRLEFDDRGFPTVINIDIAPPLADDELLYTIESFMPLQ